LIFDKNIDFERKLNFGQKFRFFHFSKISKISILTKISSNYFQLYLKQKASRASMSSLRSKSSLRRRSIGSKTSNVETEENEWKCRLAEFVPVLNVDDENSDIVVDICTNILDTGFKNNGFCVAVA